MYYLYYINIVNTTNLYLIPLYMCNFTRIRNISIKMTNLELFIN